MSWWAVDTTPGSAAQNSSKKEKGGKGAGVYGSVSQLAPTQHLLNMLAAVLVSCLKVE